MLILALDTATPRITVAVRDGERVLARAEGEGAMAHGELLAPSIAQAAREAGIRLAEVTDVAVGVGPGPFTGLRVGVVTALTLAQTLGARAHGRCTLDLVAAAVPTDGSGFVAATDARRKEVYWARYDAAGRRQGEPQVSAPADVAALGLPVHGPGGRLYRDLLGDGLDIEPDAGVLADLVARGAAEYPALPLEPLYLRRPDAQPLSVARLS